MNDDFLDTLKDPPRPEFARALRERLRDEAEAAESARARWRPWFTVAAAAAALVAVFAIPAVRVSAQVVLDLFRVRDFTAVSFDPARLERVHQAAGGQAFGMLEEQQVLRDPGPARAASNFTEASSMAALDTRQPQELPGGATLDSLWVTGAGEANLVLRAAPMRSLLDALELRDVELPPDLDGRTVHVATSPIVAARYKAGRRQVVFVQARSPEVALPAGVDVTRLGEIGLRVLGLSEAEAHRLSAQIDWRNTLVVPVPLNASSFRAITVQGHRGLLISTRGGSTPDVPGPSFGPRDGDVVLWSAGDRVFALIGTLEGTQLLRMAESVR